MTQTLSPKDRTRRSFASFLPWAFEIDDGVVLCKDGGFMMAWDVRCDDFGSLSEPYRDYILMTFVAAIGQLDSGWSLHFDYLREPLPPMPRSKFPDPVTQRIEDARVARFNRRGVMFGSTLTLTLRWTPPKNAERRIVERIRTLANRGKAKAQGVDPMFEERYGTFLDGVARFEDRASDVLGLRRLVTTRLSGSGIPFSPIQSHLFQVVYGMERTLTAHATHDSMYLDCKLSVADLHAGITPHLDGKYIAVMGIDDFPAETSTDMFSELAGMGAEYRWSTRFILLTAAETESQMAAHRRKWAQSSSSFIAQYLGKQATGYKAQVAAERVADTDAAMVESSSGTVRYGLYTSVFVFRHEKRDVLVSAMRDVRSALGKVGCVGRIERENATEAFLGSFPGETKMNVRRPLLHTMHLANVLPLTNPWSGSAKCPSPLIEDGEAPALMRTAAAGCTAFDFNLHEGDVGHTLIFGATGSGKSVLLAMLAAQWRRYPNARVIAFDKGQSLRALTLAVDGVWRELGLDAKSGFRPIETLAAGGELGPGDQVWLAEWVADIARMNGVEPDAAKRREITEAVTSISPAGSDKSMLALQIAVQNQDIKDVFARYSGDGDFATIYDAGENDDGEFAADFLCYELEELHTMPPEAVLPLLTFIFRTIENAADGRPTLILLDEAWALLGHKVFAERIREWLKVMRKKNVAVVMATQSLSDAVKSGLMDVLVESCPTKIFGSNPEAEGPAAEHYRALGLPDDDIHIVSRLTRKRQYYVVKGGQRRVMDMALGPEELKWVGVSDPDTIKELLELKAARPDDWRMAWERSQDESLAA